jgi:hypothetical protein
MEEHECTDWGTDWQNDPSDHRHSTSNQRKISFAKPGSSKHSDSQQESGNYWGTE